MIMSFQMKCILVTLPSNSETAGQNILWHLRVCPKFQALPYSSTLCSGLEIKH